jgi:hypothetical protein
MNIFLTGDDSITIRFHKEKQKAAFLEQYPDGKVRSYSFTLGNIEEVARLVAELAPNFFSLPEIFIVEDISLLGRKEQKFLLEAIKQKPPEKYFVGIENKPLPKSDALYKDLNLLGVPVETYLKKERSRQSLVEELWKKHKGRKLPPRLVAEIGGCWMTRSFSFDWKPPFCILQVRISQKKS